MILDVSFAVAKRCTMIENTNNENFKDVVRQIKLTKTHSNPVSIIVITFEQIEIKMSVFRGFAARQSSVILVHS
jgi:hypothetical protein